MGQDGPVNRIFSEEDFLVRRVIIIKSQMSTLTQAQDSSLGKKEDPGNISINHSYLDTFFSVLCMEVKDLHMFGKSPVAELHLQLSVLTLGQNEDNLVPLAFHAPVQALWKTTECNLHI